jgi:hypothetical protein
MKTDLRAHEDGVIRSGNKQLQSPNNQDASLKEMTAPIDLASAQKGASLTLETPESVAGSRTIHAVQVKDNTSQPPKPEVSSIAQIGYTPRASDQLDSLQERHITLELVGTSSNSRTPKTSPPHGLHTLNLALVGQCACVVAPADGVRIYDLTRETHPALVSAIHYPHDPIWFQPVENIGILRASSAGVVIVDLSKIKDPKPIPFDNYHDCRFQNCGLAVLSLGSLVVDLSNRADVAHRVHDFADPLAVRDLGKVHFWAKTATFHKNWLLLGSSEEPKVKPVLIGRDGIREMEPILLDSDAGMVVPVSIAAIGSRLYVIGHIRYETWLLTYDLSELPQNLPILNKQPFEPIPYASQMTHHGSWLCLIEGIQNGRVYLFDVSDPDNIKRAATLNEKFHAATVRDDRVYASDDRDVWVYAITQVTNQEP